MSFGRWSTLLFYFISSSQSLVLALIQELESVGRVDVKSALNDPQRLFSYSIWLFGAGILGSNLTQSHAVHYSRCVILGATRWRSTPFLFLFCKAVFSSER